MLDEVLEVLRIRAVRRPRKAVVAAGQDPDAALSHALHALDGALQLVVIAHLLGHRGRDAPLASVVRGVDQPRQTGRDKVLHLVRFEHVERFGVGVAAVVDDLDALAHALLDAPGAARMRGHTLAPALGFIDAGGDLGLGELALRRRHAGDRLAGEIDLQRIDAVFAEHAHAAPHLVGAGDDGAEGELMLRQVWQRRVAEAARHRDFLAGGQIARADDRAVVDGVADDDVEARLGCRRTDATRPTHIEITLGNAGTPQDVLLRRHALDAVERRLVVPRKMRVRLDHARHQEGAGAVDHRRPRDRWRALAVGGLHDTRNPVAADQHVAGVRLLAASVEDAHVGEQDVAHRLTSRTG